MWDNRNTLSRIVRDEFTIIKQPIKDTQVFLTLLNQTQLAYTHLNFVDDHIVDYILHIELAHVILIIFLIIFSIGMSIDPTTVGGSLSL